MQTNIRVCDLYVYHQTSSAQTTSTHDSRCCLGHSPEEKIGPWTHPPVAAAEMSRQSGSFKFLVSAVSDSGID